jgi:SAM-dependent methyltransferase
MTQEHSPEDRRRQLSAWFGSPLGRALEAFEAHRLRALLPSLYGTVAAQLGCLGRLDLLDACNAPTRIVLDPQAPGAAARLRARPEELPFDARSVDLLLLPHTLDFCDDPHAVLREAARVLSPEGHVVIFGFNPVSLWGLRRLFAARPRPAPWFGNFFRLARVRDWLALLDFEFTHGGMLFYRPPFAAEGVMQRLHTLDKMGDRWWPLLAAVYMVVAKKRVLGMTPLPLPWQERRLPGAAGRAVPVRRSAGARGLVIPFVHPRARRLG